jgi:anti-sigma factor RsiW
MSFDGKATAQERFELLSAYIDNEVTSTEKSQVEQWLKDDLNYRTQYQQLLKVKRLLLDLPAPSSVSTELLVSKVIAKIDRRSQRKLAISGAIMALVIAIFGSVANNYRLKLADDINNNEEQLILAMEEPIIPMPESLRR